MKEVLRDFSLSALFLMPFPIAVIFIPFPHVLSHIWYSFPSQTHCHKGVDDKVCFLQEKKRKAVIDGVSIPLSVLSPDCFGWVHVSYPGTVSECFILPYWQTCEGCVALWVPFCRAWVCCLWSTVESFTDHLLDRGVQLQDLSVTSNHPQSLSSLPWQAFCPVFHTYQRAFQWEPTDAMVLSSRCLFQC